jgi:hypothetical protein
LKNTGNFLGVLSAWSFVQGLDSIKLFLNPNLNSDFKAESFLFIDELSIFWLFRWSVQFLMCFSWASSMGRL